MKKVKRNWEREKWLFVCLFLIWALVSSCGMISKRIQENIDTFPNIECSSLEWERNLFNHAVFSLTGVTITDGEMVIKKLSVIERSPIGSVKLTIKDLKRKPKTIIKEE